MNQAHILKRISNIRHLRYFFVRLLFFKRLNPLFQLLFIFLLAMATEKDVGAGPQNPSSLRMTNATLFSFQQALTPHDQRNSILLSALTPRDQRNSILLSASTNSA